MTARKTNEAARIERLQLQERTAVKLSVLLDADVQRWFDAIDAELVQTIVEASQVDGDRCRLFAMRLRAVREVRDFIAGAVHNRDRITEKLQELTNAA